MMTDYDLIIKERDYLGLLLLVCLLELDPNLLFLNLLPLLPHEQLMAVKVLRLLFKLYAR